jgi:hypothetical protein
MSQGGYEDPYIPSEDRLVVIESYPKHALIKFRDSRESAYPPHNNIHRGPCFYAILNIHEEFGFYKVWVLGMQMNNTMPCSSYNIPLPGVV